MKHLAILALLVFSSLCLSAQEKYLSSVAETQQLSQKIVDLFAKSKVEESFKIIAKYWPLPQNEIDAIESKTIKYLNLIEDRFGNSIGTVKVNNETIAEIAIRETYIIRYEHSAIRLIFTFYKNDNGWIINAFKWDDSFSEEFK